MLERIKTSLCHPKYIGLFFKDKLYKPILLMMIFLAIFAGSIITKCLLTDQFGASQAITVEKIIQYSTDSNGNKPTVNVSYDKETKKITGETMAFTSDEMVLSFLPTTKTVNQNKVTVFLYEESYLIYYGYFKIGEGYYKNEDLESFSIAKVQTGDTVNCINFRAFLVGIFDRAQTTEALVIATQAIISNFVYYVLVVILCLFAAYFLNPSIEFKIRIKLVLYDSLSYFYWYLLALLIGVNWLEYVALIVPFIFTNITFAHIRRVR